jgi:hypothetical protein
MDKHSSFLGLFVSFGDNMTLTICSLLMSAALTSHDVTRLLILMPLWLVSNFLKVSCGEERKVKKEGNESQKERVGIGRSL